MKKEIPPIYLHDAFTVEGEDDWMTANSEIKELNRLICRQCSEKEYEKCKNCKVYQLINRIATQ